MEILMICKWFSECAYWSRSSVSGKSIPNVLQWQGTHKAETAGDILKKSRHLQAYGFDWALGKHTISSVVSLKYVLYSSSKSYIIICWFSRAVLKLLDKWNEETIVPTV